MSENDNDWDPRNYASSFVKEADQVVSLHNTFHRFLIFPIFS